ncbi:hypothetical protein HaLaN_14385 [Haematococcus lacustris]|uniref:Uncharacterized protein n=1 Tax=Haematococcus lacustris TaxID=44745 RepID=A0A699Z8E7_HAELA|nr:hypothetical protein HaLaN_14385 [Haematococcus lacustris]
MSPEKPLSLIVRGVGGSMGGVACSPHTGGTLSARPLGTSSNPTAKAKRTPRCDADAGHGWVRQRRGGEKHRGSVQMKQGTF